MKLVKAIINPERFGIVRKALEESGFVGMTITTVEGNGIQLWNSRDNCEKLIPFDLLPRIQVELVVQYNMVDNLVSTILESCRTGEVGDDRIYVMQVDKVIRIRTGEIQEDTSSGGESDASGDEFPAFRPNRTELGSVRQKVPQSSDRY